MDMRSLCFFERLCALKTLEGEIMKALQATPKTVRALFREDKFIIPSFQREYTWEEADCIQLFEDIQNFYDEHPVDKESYYLGNIILYADPDENAWVVVDGQQRLTTLLLLLRGIFFYAQTATVLEECWKRKDPLSGQITNESKVETRVFEQDRRELEDIVFNGDVKGKHLLKQNYRKFLELLEEFFDGKNSQQKERFIMDVLDRVVLLPIECDSLDDALILFNRVNARGRPLGDADIFKARLYQFAKNDADRKELIARWNNFDDVGDLFTHWMHVIRAGKGATSREIALRKFFNEPDNAELLKDWRTTLDSLEKLNYREYEGDVAPVKAENLECLLYDLKNAYSWYPLSVFWYKHSYLQDHASVLPDDRLEEYGRLVERTVKYYYLYSVAYNSINTIKDATYRVCSAIWHDEDYLIEYQKGHAVVYEDFKKKIIGHRYGKGKRGLVSLLAVLNEKQDQQALFDLEVWDVEHILPQKGGYNAYDGGTEKQYEDEVDSLGNLVMLEKPLNITASNSFFQKKKEKYKKSIIQDVLDLVSLDTWTYEAYTKRAAEREATLLEFFREMK
jgi:hypothetical protein